MIGCTVRAGHLWLCWSGCWLNSYVPAPLSSQIPGIDMPNWEARGCWHCLFTSDEQRPRGCWDLAKVSQEVCGGCSRENSLKYGGQPPSTQRGGRRAKAHTDSHAREQKQSFALGSCQIPSMGTSPSAAPLCSCASALHSSWEDLIWEAHRF